MSIQSEFQKNIQTIAKTDELVEKTDRALRDVEAAKKAKIDVVRLATGVAGGNTKQTGSGGNASGNSVTVNTATGTLDSLVVPATGAANSSPSQPTSAQSALAALEAAARNQAGSSTNPNGSNDLSSAIKDALAEALKNLEPQPAGGGGGGGGGGSSQSPNMGDKGNASGSNVATQAAPLDTGTVEANIASSMYAKGATTAQVNEAIESYRMHERGVHEVGTVVQGSKNTPKLTLNGNNQYQNQNKSVDTLEGVVGVDPDNPTLAMVVRFDKFPLLPNAFDVAGADQNSWPIDGITSPERKYFYQGFVWTSAYGTAATPGELDAPALAAAIPGYPGTGHKIYNHIITTLGSDPADCTYKMSYTDGSSVFHDDITISVATTTPCIPGSSSTCPINAPRESLWPVAEAYALEFLSGKFIGSGFDGDLPFKYTNPTSEVKIKSNYTGLSYVITAGVEGGTLMYEDGADPEYALYYGADRTLQAIVPGILINFYKPK